MATRHVVMFSGGIGSWAAAKRVAQAYGTDNLTLLFSDTLREDDDLYRFLVDGAANIFGLPDVDISSFLPLPEDLASRLACLHAIRSLANLYIPGLVWISEGRDIWQVFKDERFLGNTRADPCSKILKRQMADKWLSQNCDILETIIHVGIDWTEINRFDGLRERRRPWLYEAPLCAPPYISKIQMLEMCRAEGIEPPRLYAMGFSHNNCGGGCVKAGIGHFTNLYQKLPSVFSQWERNEEDIRQHLGRYDIAILRDRTGGTSKPLTLASLRQRLEAGTAIDHHEIGGCGCFIDD